MQRPSVVVFCLALIASLVTASGRLACQETEAIVERAQAAFGEGQKELALAEVDRALRLDPEHAAARKLRGLIHESRDAYADALTDLGAYLDVVPDDAEGWLARGRVFHRSGQGERALEDLRRAADLAPDDPEVRGWLGVTLAQEDRYAEAEVELRRALRDADEAWVHYWLGYALYMQDENAAAVRSLRRAMALEPGDSDTRGLLAAALLDAGRSAAALEQIDIAIALDPTSAEHHALRGEILTALGRHRSADAAFRRAQELDPTVVLDDPLLDLDLWVPWIRAALIGLLVLSLLTLPWLKRTNAALALGANDRGGATAPRFDGAAGDLTRLYLRNVVLTLLTLGVYSFWAKVDTRRFLHQHTSFADGRFDYHVTGLQKFLGFAKGMAALSPLIVALYFAYGALEQRYDADVAWSLCFWGFFVALFLLRPLILVGGQRFNLSHTSWSGLRFRFTGTVREAYGIYLRDLVLIVCTLGIHTAWHTCNVRRFRLKHTRMGADGLSFRGEGAELLAISISGILASYITLGLLLPWYFARRHRFMCDMTYFKGRPFRSTLTAGLVFRVGVPAVLLSVVTLGLAIPWAMTRWRRMITHTTVYRGTIDVEQLRSSHDAASSAFAEGIGEAGDVLGEIGEFFGA
ncbi:MAG: tetratricopeptide repeat protein [Planctomycetota bacterium]